MLDIDNLLGIKADPHRAARGKAAEPHITGRRLERTAARREFRNAVRSSNALEALADLPAENETHHYIMPGTYDSFDLIPAIIERAGSPIYRLLLATLGFNIRHAKRLIALMDAGQIGCVGILVSCYYNADTKEADTIALLQRELADRGGYYAAARSHAKVIAAKMIDQNCYVIESSANLRTCHNVEQFTITRSRPLFDFHAQWQQELALTGLR